MDTVERIFADGIARYHGERYVAAIVAGRAPGDVTDPSLTPLQQLIDDVQRVTDYLESVVDLSHDSTYWKSDLLNSVERIRRAANTWREIAKYAREP